MATNKGSRKFLAFKCLSHIAVLIGLYPHLFTVTRKPQRAFAYLFIVKYSSISIVKKKREEFLVPALS